MEIFAITVQIAGRKSRVWAEAAPGGIEVRSEAGAVHVSELHAAIDVAGRTLGPLLEHARRNGAPWGLHVTAWNYQAVYGSWPLLPGPVAEARSETPISRIRSRFRDG